MGLEGFPRQNPTPEEGASPAIPEIQSTLRELQMREAQLEQPIMEEAVLEEIQLNPEQEEDLKEVISRIKEKD